jgi:ACS family hexuronate transporter-like MFS transporter
MSADRPPSWKWSVCGLLLLATMLNYMDRQTLSQLAQTICNEYRLTNQQYGDLEMGFGFAFAAGALFFGFLVDRLSALWLYPAVLLGWSAAGIATAYADEIGRLFLDWSAAASDPETFHSRAAYSGFMICRVVLGFFEAGHWPCALVTTQTILSRQDRAFGNSILQSGAAIGAIITPLVVLASISDIPGGWRPPFVAIGALGIFWVVPWLMMVRPRDLVRKEDAAVDPDYARAEDAPPSSFWRPFIVLVIVVVMINITWQLFRAWLPKFLEDQHEYTRTQVGLFTSGYYVAADVGCIGAGFVVKWLADGGWKVHSARMAAFSVCTLLTLLSLVVAFLPRGPLLLLLLLAIAAATLGLFPNYYSFTQELSKKHQGKITGVLGTVAWLGSSPLQRIAGQSVDQTGSYATVIVMAGLAPLVGLLALWLLWPRTTGERGA